MPPTDLRREQPTSNFHRRLKAPRNAAQGSQEPLRVGSGIFAATALVGISIIATELLVIATPSTGFAATFILLVLAALLTGYMLACAVVRIFKREE